MTTYAIACDLSGVIPTEDGFGKFTKEIEALEHLIEMLEARREETQFYLTRARRRALKARKNDD